MAKVKFSVDSGANINSCNESKWYDTVEDLGLEEREWENYSDDQKWEFADEWAQERLSIYYEEDYEDE